MEPLSAYSHVDDPARLHEAFRHEEWLQAYPLTLATVLDYFAFSQFYQMDCLNESYKLQGFTGLALAAAMASSNAAGVEYVARVPGQGQGQAPIAARPGSSSSSSASAESQQADLFVIERRLRGADGSVAVLSVYYCLRGTIYQVPDLSTLVSSRVERAAEAVTKAAKEFQAAAAAPAGATSSSFIGRDAPRSVAEASFRTSLDEAIRALAP